VNHRSSALAPGEPSGRSQTVPYAFEALLLAAGVLAAAHLFLVFRIEINWDEFHFLSLVHEYRRGSLDLVLQTFHVLPFAWLPHLGPDEVDQVLGARSLYWALLVGSSSLLFLIARRIASPPAALFTVLAFLSYGEVVGHGTSFRADGLALFFCLGCVALIVRGGKSTASSVSAGVLAAVALLITIKTIFYFPTFIALSLLSGPDLRWQGRVRRVLTFGVSAGMAFLALYGLHSLALAAPPVTDSVGVARQAGQKVLLWDDLFPRDDYLQWTLFSNALVWLWVAAGVAIAVLWPRALQAGSRAVVLALLLPLGSVAVYRNAFPYFFVFIVPPALVAAALPVEMILRRRGWSAGRLAILSTMVLTLLAPAAAQVRWHLQDDLSYQRQVLDLVHELFPEPVPYIDGHDVVASFPKIGFFMSSWGLENYWTRGEPIFEDLLIRHQPRFLLVTTPALAPPRDRDESTGLLHLLPEDRRILASNFVRYWGPLRVPGKDVRVEREGTSVEILLGGVYDIESPDTVTIDDRAYAPGGHVRLEPGVARITSTAPSSRLILRLSLSPSPPPAPPEEPLFRGFYPCGTPVAPCASGASPEASAGS